MTKQGLIISDTLHEDKTIDIAFYGVNAQTIGLIYCNVTLRLPFGLPLKTAIRIFVGLLYWLPFYFRPYASLRLNDILCTFI